MINELDQPSEMPSERRTFVMHENLLRDVIQRQAGSIGKAVLEGVMNLIEAGATEGNVTLEPSRIVIRDNGRGFETRDEILEAFEVFGKSDERKAKAGRWAEFQMGRGQLMAFGKTTYRTRTFEMVVDIGQEARGSVGYELRQGLDDLPGCTVTVDLFEELDEWSVVHTIDEIKRAIRYVDVPVTLNGTVVTVDPSTEKWSFQDENAYYRVATQKTELELYNLGVFVSSNTYWGVGGVIVSKKRLALNFARNDVLSNCAVWKAVLKEFKKRTGAAVLEKKAPTAKDVQFIVEELLEGRFPIERVMNANLLRDANGRRLSPSDLVRRILCIGYNAEDIRITAFALDHAKSDKADYAMHSRPWLILDAEFCNEAFGAFQNADVFDELADLGEVLHLTACAIRGGAEQFERVRSAFRPVEAMYRDLDFKTTIIPDAKLSRDEATVMTALRGANRELARVCSEQPRKLVVGVSEGSLAWTDGSRIVIDRQFLRHSIARQHGLLSMLHTLLHEYTHARAQLDGHDLEFYKRFHDAAMRVAPAHNAILSRVMRVANNRLKTFTKSLTVAIEARRRLMREGLRTQAERILPCPVCAAFGGKSWTQDEVRGFVRCEGISGIAFSALARAVRSPEAFEAEFGSRWPDPQTFKKGQVAVCVVCEEGTFAGDVWKQITKQMALRLCELAVLCAASDEQPPAP